MTVAVVLAVAAMLVVQGVMHAFFMRLPMLQYHLVTAALNAAVVVVAAVLYVKWRHAALRAQEALRQLQASEALRADLTSMLVHDLKNPLTGSLAASQMLLAHGQDLSDTARDFLDMAIRGQKRLVSMIEDLLDTARAEEGKLPLNLADNDLAPIIEQAVAEVALSAAQAEVHLITQFAPCAPVPSDADKVRRIVGNLLSNAIKFSPRGSSITVSLNCTPEQAVVAVQDTGPGVPLELQERIFDKFAQVEAAAGGHRLSVGLGLTFCKLAVEAQGGRIWTESVPGEGSTFSFSLPLEAATGDDR